jgi:hypothetical protein
MGTSGSTLPNLEEVKARLSYAWNVWEFHGRQRMNMFNYFLVITGILVNGYINAVKENSLHRVVPAICLLGLVQCLVFLMIDWRNRTMLYFADSLLKDSEKELFKSPSSERLGPMSQRTEKESKGLFCASKMVYWIWATYIAVGIAFLMALIRSIYAS